MKYDQEFYKDFYALLKGTKSAHMGSHVYADHTGMRGEQSMSGAKLWELLADIEPDYPISRADTALLQRELSALSYLLPQDLTLYDLGPGGEQSITTKSIAIIKEIQANCYCPVDASLSFIEAACGLAKAHFPQMVVKPCVNNLFSGAYGINEPTLVYFGGGTIANLVHPLSDIFPEMLFIDTLENLSTYAPYGWMLISFDSSTDKDVLYKRYGNKTNSDFTCNVMYRAFMELPLENFDPDKFVAAPLWNEKSYQFAQALKASEAQDFLIDGERIHIDEGQLFHIANSYKYPTHVFEKAVNQIGYDVEYKAIDESGMALYLLRSPRASRLNAKQKIA